VLGALPNKPPLVLVEGVDEPACAEADCPKGGGGLPKRPPGAGADSSSPPLGAPDAVPDPNSPPVPAPKNPPPWLLDMSVTLLINVCRFGVLRV